MVAVIKFSTSLKNVLNYNETKLRQDTNLKDGNGHFIKKAEFIHSSGFAKDTEKLGFTDKFKRIEKQMRLSETRKKNIIHISLNFDPSEVQKLDPETLKKIADTYMEKIGFANQPYLVYKHNDAGHPHIHLVSTIIKNDGIPIETHNIGKNFSEPARKEIEQLFGLVVADQHKQKEAFELKPINAQKIQYGRSETLRAITNVLDAVLFNYKYTSISELNAILAQYNVIADTGKENSRIQKNKGLNYRILDENCNKIGVPIKASKIYCNPGLKFLEHRFEKNKILRVSFKTRVKNAIDLTLARPSISNIEDFQEALRRQKIQVVIRQNKEGRIYGLTFIDYQNKCVFNGSDLGKQYSATGIQDRLSKEKIALKDTIQKQEPQQLAYSLPQPLEKPIPTSLPKKHKLQPKSTVPVSKETQPDHDKNNLLSELIKPEYTPDTIPSELKRKKKRKRKRLHL